MTDLVSVLSGLPATTVLIALVATAGLLVIVADWRLLNLLLGVQFLLIGALLIVSQIEGFPIELAIVKALVGVMTVPVLYISSRRARWGRDPDEEDEEDLGEPRPRFVWLRAPGLALRAIVALLGMAVALSLALRSPIQFLTPPAAARDITIAAFALISQGLMNLALNENPLKVGLGLLSVTAGFEVFYTPAEPTLVVVALLGIFNLLIALAMSYLIAAWAARPRGAA
ncbi:MAG TPA: hypothetical protein VIK33_09680 [Anaerolineae bacterium]